MTDPILQNAEPPAAPRARLLATAARLFRENGINATGIDAIIGAAGVAKTTLYANFKSKNELVAAVLQAEAQGWQDWFVAATDLGQTPRDRLDKIFPALKIRLGTDAARGSLLVNAVGEHSRDANWLRVIAARHRAWIVSHIAELAAAAGADGPELLAGQIGLLLDGAISAAMVTHDPVEADAAGAATTVLLDVACGLRKTRRARQIGLQGGAAALAKEDLNAVDE